MEFIDKIAAANVRLVSAATPLECLLVIESRKGEQGRTELELFVNEAKLEVIPFDRLQMDSAALAWRSYGKGRHAAALKYGDCFAYALTKVTGEPLLFKGCDFSRTDIQSC